MFETCIYCNKKLEIKNSSVNRGTMHNHRTRCDEFKKTINDKLTKEFLHEEYIIKRKAAYQISKEINIGVNPIIRKLKEFDIETRSISQAKKELLSKSRAEHTNFVRYGAKHNFCRNHPSRIQWETELLLNEGITNVFQRKEVIDKINEKFKNKEYKTSKFGAYPGSRYTKPHATVVDEIRKIFDCKIILEFKANKNITKFYDIYIPEYNLIIEINGDYFHANPRKYKYFDYIELKNKTSQQIWEYDKEKIELAKNAGYYILILWEYDIKNNIDLVLQLIKKVIENNNDDKNKICEESFEYLRAL